MFQALAEWFNETVVQAFNDLPQGPQVTAITPEELGAAGAAEWREEALAFGTQACDNAALGLMEGIRRVNSTPAPANEFVQSEASWKELASEHSACEWCPLPQQGHLLRLGIKPSALER